MKDFLQAIVYGGLFLVLFLPLYVANDLFFPFITGKNFAFRVIVEVLFGAWILLALLDAKYRPNFSWILTALTAFIGVVTIAALVGEHPATSFWSNYERMDGVVTLIHLFMYVVVLGSANFSARTWNTFLATSVGVAVFVALRGLFGMNTGGADRVDSTLGNAAYMAVYMLFNIFFAALLFVRSKDVAIRAGYVLIALVFAYTMLLTGTRGTFLGLLGGAFVSVVYVAVFGARFPGYRKIALGGIVAVVLLAAGFYAVRDTGFVQSNSSLARIANTDLVADLQIRSIIWGMALEGVKERPLLGWGHGNFNFVFNREYESELWGQEQWFDRVHNIFLDWLTAAGVLGFLTYFSVMVAVLYYLVWLPMWRKDPEEHFNVLERAVLIGLLSGYLVHNLVVFDNIISYIFYGTLLALIHARVGAPLPRLAAARISERVVVQVALPVIAIATVAVIYFVNVPSYLAAGDIIDAMRGDTPRVRLEQFNSALKRNGFGDQEIVEQLAQQAMAIARDPSVSAEDRDMFVTRAELELLRMIEEKPGDARLHIFLSNYYRAIGALPQAKEQAALARSLSPDKPAMMVEQGVIEIQLGNLEGARDFFKEAYDAAPAFEQSRTFYAALLFATNDAAGAKALLTDETHLKAFALNDYAVSIVQQQRDLAFLAELFELRVTANPSDAQNWASLAFVYFELTDRERAIETLGRAGEAVPSFKPQAACIASNIEAGRSPETPCEP